VRTMRGRLTGWKRMRSYANGTRLIWHLSCSLPESPDGLQDPRPPFCAAIGVFFGCKAEDLCPNGFADCVTTSYGGESTRRHTARGAASGASPSRASALVPCPQDRAPQFFGLVSNCSGSPSLPRLLQGRVGNAGGQGASSPRHAWTCVSARSPSSRHLTSAQWGSSWNTPPRLSPACAVWWNCADPVRRSVSAAR
jgi:hypothetical protein